MRNKNSLSPHWLFTLVAGTWALVGCAFTAPPVTDLPDIELSAPPTATQTLRPSPPSETPESGMTPSHATLAAPFTTYTNEYYNFAIDYPSDVEVSVQSDGPFQLLIYTEPENPFYLRATRDFLPGDVVYFLDTSPIAETIFGAYLWQTYNLPNGYGDATGSSPPIYAFQMQASDVLYTIVFFNRDSLSELQAHILATFRILTKTA